MNFLNNTHNTMMNSNTISDDWFNILMATTAEARKKRSFLPKFRTQTHSLMKYIALICTKLKYSSEIEFAALDTIDHFFMNKFLNLMQCIDNESEAVKIRKIHEIHEEMQMYGVLQSLCILLLCAKNYGTYVYVELDTITDLIRATHNRFSTKVIKQCELYTFKQLNYQLEKPITFYFVEYFILKICNLLLGVEADELGAACDSLLRLCYVYRDMICQCFVKYFCSKAFIDLLLQDKCLLAAAVTYIVLNKKTAITKKLLDIALDKISDWSLVEKHDIICFSKCIVNVLKI